MKSNSFKSDKSSTRSVRSGLFVLLLVCISVITLLPLFWAFCSSLRQDDEIFKYINPFSWYSIFPKKVVFQAYINLFTIRKFYIPVFNTVFVGFINIIFGIVVNAMAGFAFAKLKFRGKKVLFFLVMISFMVPFEAIAIPLYSLINNLHWVDTYLALIIPGISNGLAIYLFRQFFEEIPDSIVESAIIDGAGWQTIFYKIILPLSKPVIITASLMIFMTQWEAFLWPMIAARSTNLKMIQVALTDFQMQYSTLWSELFAASIITALVPVLCLLPFQKYYIQGLTDSGVKG